MMGTFPPWGLWRNYVVKRTAFNVSASGDITLVSAVSGKMIRVLGYYLHFGGDTNITWKSGTNTLLGPLSFGQYGGEIVEFNNLYLLDTNSGEALILTSSSAVAISGVVYYVEI